MSKGYVYILINQFMPGLVKIGKTTRDPSARAEELFQTGVPGPFEVYRSFYCPDCHELERTTHEEMDDRRLSPSREFFVVSPEEAAEIVSALHETMLWAWINEYLPGTSLVDSDHYVCEGAMKRVADGLSHMAPGMTVADVAAAISYSEPNDFIPMFARWGKESLNAEAVVTHLRVVGGDE